MAVLLSNTTLAVRARQAGGRDTHGALLPTGWGEETAYLPGYAEEDADGVWTLGVDPALWPVHAGDLVVDPAGREWLALTADRLFNSVDPTVDWVRVTAHERVGGHTEPGGARYSGTP